MANHNDTDTRIVEMQFDAKDFDKNIRSSQKTLEDFKKSLNFDDAVKQMSSFAETNEQASKTFAQMAKDISHMALEMTGIGPMYKKIAYEIEKSFGQAKQSIINFGKTLTTVQAKAGEEKYEKLLKNVLTIKNATGETDEVVYEVMERLNHYTDQTSYSFTEMAENIGKFTSVGVPLKEAEKQMEGIANWAARSGGGIQEANRAMYNLSQAMGMGALTAMDWKSIENAGMATKEFKNQLIQAGLAAGTLVKQNGKIMTDKKFGKQIEVTYQNIRETLSKKWADTETLQKAFMAYYYEDLDFTGEISAAVKTQREERDAIRDELNKQTKDPKLNWDDWIRLGKDSKETRQAIIDTAVEQKKLVKETNAEGYTVYKTLKKNGKEIEISTANIKEFFDAGLFDESMATVTFNLDADPLIEMTQKQLKAVRDALGDDNVILKKDWVETMHAAGLATDDVKKAAMEAGVKAKTLTKEVQKDGTIVYKTAKSLGKEMVVTMDNFEDSLRMKWFNEDTADTVSRFTDIAKSSYEAAQRCTNFQDAMNAIKDMLSTGWMTSYEHIFGKLADAMNLFSGMCNKASDMLGKFKDARNKLLESWSSSGGRNSLWGALIGEIEGIEGDAVFEGAYGLLDALGNIGDMATDALRDLVSNFVSGGNLERLYKEPEYVFEYLGVLLANLTERFQEFVGKIKGFFDEIPAGQTESRMTQIQHVAEALYAAVLLVTQVIGGIGQFAGEVLGQLQPAFDAVLGLISFLGQLFTGKVVEATKKNSIGNFFHNLAEILRPLTTIVNVAVNVLAKLVASIATLVSQSGILQAFGNVIKFLSQVAGVLISRLIDSGVFQTMMGWAQAIFTNVPKIISRLRELGTTLVATFLKSKTFQNIGKVFTNIFGGEGKKSLLSSIVNSLDTTFKDLPKSLPKLVDRLKGFVSSLGTFIDGFFGNILGLFVGSAKADEVSEEMGDAIVAVLTPGEKGTGGSSSSSTTAAKGIIDRIKEAFENIWNPVSEFIGTLFNETIPNFFNKQIFKDIRNFFSGLNLVDLMRQSTQLMKWLSIFRAGSGLVSIGKGISSVGKGIKVFGKNLKKLELVNVAIKKFKISNKSTNFGSMFENLGSTMLKMAAAIGVVAYAAIELSKIEPDKLIQAGIAIGVITTVLVAAGAAAKKWAGNGTSILGIGASLMLIVLAMKTVASIPWLGKGGTFAGGLLEMLAKLSLIMVVLAGVGRMAGKVNMKGFVGFAVAINILIIALKSMMKLGPLIKSSDNSFGFEATPLLTAMGILIALLGTMGVVAKLAGKTQLKGFLGFAIAINLLMIPLKSLAKALSDKDQVAGIINAFAMLEILMGSIAAVIALTNGKNVSKLAGLVGAIAVLTGIGLIIGSMPLANVLTGFLALDILIATMGFMFSQAAKLNEKQIKELSNIFKSITVLVGIMAVATAAFTFIPTPDGTNKLAVILSFVGGLDVMLFALSGMMKQASKMNEKALGKVSLVFGIISVMVGVIAGSLILIASQGVDWSLALSFLGGTALVVAAMALVMPVLAGMQNAGAALKGILVMSAVVLAIGLVLSLLAEMAGQSMENIANHIAMVGSYLGLFQEMTAGLDVASMTEMLGGLKDMATIMVEISLMDFGENLSNFETNLVRAGASARLFSLMTAGFDAEKSKSVTSALKDMATDLSGFPEVSDVGTSIGNIGGAIKLYAESLNGVDLSTAPDSTAIKQVFDTLKGALPEDENLTEVAAYADGDKGSQMTNFAIGLTNIATAVSDFSTSAKDLDFGAITEATSALTAISTLNTSLSTTTVASFGPFAVELSQQKESLTTFSEDIVALGTALKDFGTNIGDVDMTKLQNGTDALTKIAELNDKLPKTGGISQWFTGTESLSNFSACLKLLGAGVKDFNESIAGGETELDTEKMKAAGEALKVIAEVNDALPETGGLKSWFTGEKSLGSFGQNMKTLGEGVAGFSQAVKGTPVSRNVTDSVELIRKLSNIQVKLGNAETWYDLSTFGSSLAGLATQVKTAAETMAQIVFPDNLGTFESFVDAMVSAFVKLGNLKFEKSLDDLGGEVAGFFRQIWAFTQDDKGFFGGGIVDTDRIDRLTNSVTSIFDSINGFVVNSTADGEFAQTGMTILSGISAGLTSEEGLASLNTAMATVAATISQSLADNIVQPTITPVFSIDSISDPNGLLSGETGSFSLDLSASLSTALASLIPSGPIEVTVSNPVDLTTVNTAIAAVQTQIQSLNTAISNIKIVLNTGAIAGGVTDGVDQNLGRKAMYAGRRNSTFTYTETEQ